MSANILPYFVEGSSSEDLPDSRALPAIWENVDDVAAKYAALGAAAAAVAAAAPQGQEAFNAAFPALGQACGACHETYRKPQD